MELNLGSASESFQNRLAVWKKGNAVQAIWNRNPAFWFEEDPGEITNRLGWLDLPTSMGENLNDVRRLKKEVQSEPVSDLVLLGMGGSSLAPDVFQRTFGNRSDCPKLTVLDSTHPDAVRTVVDHIGPETTLFLVASKSGTTTEIHFFLRYFWDYLQKELDQPGKRFIATTDPDTPLEDIALERNFLNVFRAPPDVGGRYSALSHFGLVPAVLIGMDVERYLNEARVMAEACGPDVSALEHPALRLGAAIGELAQHGKGKLTFLTTTSLTAFPDWLEQLVAESTGKDGRGIFPVVNEPERRPVEYGDDRTFVSLALEQELDSTHREKLQSLQEEGHPVISFRLTDLYELGQEMFRWEMAVAAAGSILEIHPFNQPDVERTKTLTWKAIGEDETSIRSSVETIRAFEHPENAVNQISSWLDRTETGNYLAVQAYLNPYSNLDEPLQLFRRHVAERWEVATTSGYGPRFLHSTGQIHKGGPNTGFFLQFVDESGTNVDVPETDHSFNTLIQAQSRADYRALKEAGRDVLRVNLGSSPHRILSKLAESIQIK